MSPRTISPEELGLQTAKVLAEARKHPVLIKLGPSSTLVLRQLGADDLADELLVRTTGFRASIRRARANRRRGKGIPLGEARARLLP